MQTGLRVYLENYLEIKKRVLDLLSKHTLPECSWLGYLDDRSNPTLDRFRSIPELRSDLDLLGWSDYWISTALVVVYDQCTRIHHDHGDSTYSLLVPIINTTNTWTVFYQTKRDAIKDTLPSGAGTWIYDPAHCHEIDRFESTEPTLINTKTPHNVLNHGACQPRVMISLRLRGDFLPPQY